MPTFTSPAVANDSAIASRRTIGGGCVLLLLLLGPLFVCMPLNSDTALFDLQAERVLEGGVLYRDIVEPNLPGVVWIHLAIRPLVGWSSEAIRAVDLLILAGIVCLGMRTLPDGRTRSLFAFTAAVFYVCCNEWCHCQRDTWMLLPAMAAVLLRLRSGTDHPRQLKFAILEGTLWGCAFWIKPHVAVPALFVIAVDALHRRNRSRVIKDFAAVVAGGILAALPGIWWLIDNGAWPHFWEMMLEWNPEYLEAGRERQSPDRWLMMTYRFHPWWIVHLVAVPLAWRAIRTAITLRDRNASDRRVSLVAAVYVGWLLQAIVLQHAMDYIHAPPIVLGLLLISVWPWRLDLAPRRVATASFLCLTLLAAPILNLQRLAMWPRCWSEGSSTQVRATLAHGTFPAWQDLSRVVDFLREQRVSDGELTCLNVHSVHVFRELRVQPATRYWCTLILQDLFKRRAASIDAAVRQHTSRFIVTESIESELTNGGSPDDFPWNLPVVFEAGTYKVHATNVLQPGTEDDQTLSVRSSGSGERTEML
ncbi:MAG TPA: hypothetical protein EYG03_31115 [Planctomycetes bacterium]|nr:hypothetical protein [Fuerstiella sp.]HIK96415.1 hypothetical protein [Planctomycetota bacterium]